MSPGAPVDVAVGVVIRGDGRVLLGQRPPGKPYAGWWEFPGGKLERGESVEHALARELDEELGLSIDESVPWVIRQFTYPHATVRLHFRRVFAFRGEPHGREGQAFAWCDRDAIGVAPLLPATVPVIAWLRLPGACAFSAAAMLGEARFLDALDRRLHAGALGALLLSEPALSPARFEPLFRAVLARCRAHACRLLVDDGHPESYARAAGGMVMSTDALRRCGARPPLPTVAARVADPEDMQRAAALAIDFALCAPAARAGDLVEGIALPAYVPGTLAATRHAALRIGAQGVAHGPVFWQD